MRQWWSKRGKKWAIRLGALVLAAALAVPVLPEAVVLPASAVTQAEIDAMREESNSLKAQQKEIQAKLDALADDQANAMERKNLLEQQINATQAEIDSIAAQIAKYDELIAQKEVELAQAEEEEQAQYELFCQRVREMEEQGEISYWSILFSSASFSDLLDNAMMVEEIMEYDNQIMDQLIALREQIEEDKAELETARQEQQDAKDAQQAAQDQLKAQRSEVDALINQLAAQEADLEAERARFEAAANAADKEIAAAERELAASISDVVSESGFLWPLPGRYNLSSLYGNRKHPITGKANHHTGIDIPAPSGTSILAAKSGVVTTSTYNNSYGNYVVVSHSDGTSTLYAHMVRRGCSKGDVVSQGQTIGYVGTTGSSTGNHLHFEVRVNGSRTDPVNYFTNLPLTISGASLF